MPNISAINRNPGPLDSAPDVCGNHHLPALIRIPDVRRITGLSNSELYRRIADGTFPAQVRLGLRSVAFVESEVRGWIAARIAERDNHSPHAA